MCTSHSISIVGIDNFKPNFLILSLTILLRAQAVKSWEFTDKRERNASAHDCLSEMPLWHWVHSSFYACFAIKCDEVPYQPSKSTTCDLQPQDASTPFTGFKPFRFKDLSSTGLLWIRINQAFTHQCLTSSRHALVNCCAVYPDEAKLTQSGAFPPMQPH